MHNQTKYQVFKAKAISQVKMSKSSQYCKSVNTTKSTPCCKVCMDAGFTDKATHHWVKNSQGKVICPTLLSQECRYCYEKGHTVKYCPKNKVQIQNNTNKIFTSFAPKPTATKPAARAPSNRFALLDEDDDDMVFSLNTSKKAVKVVVVEEFPQLVPRAQIPIAPTLMSYACKVKFVPIPTAPAPTPKQPVMRPASPSSPPPAQIIRTYRKMKNWADYSDSDSDDDA